MSLVPLIPLSIIVPVKYDQTEIDQAIRAEHIRWQIERAAMQAAYPPLENVRFKHDPDWRNQFFSLTCMREGNHWFWKATKVVWVLMGGLI